LWEVRGKRGGAFFLRKEEREKRARPEDKRIGVREKKSGDTQKQSRYIEEEKGRSVFEKDLSGKDFYLPYGKSREGQPYGPHLGGREP